MNGDVTAIKCVVVGGKSYSLTASVVLMLFFSLTDGTVGK